jgi:hypothetical protein
MGRCWDSPTVPTACWAEQNLSGKDRPRLLQDVLFHEKRNQMNQDGVVTARWLKDSERLWKTLSSWPPLPGPQSPMAFSETPWAKSLVAPTSTAMSRTCSTFRCDPLPEDYKVEKCPNRLCGNFKCKDFHKISQVFGATLQTCTHAMRFHWQSPIHGDAAQIKSTLIINLNGDMSCQWCKDTYLEDPSRHLSTSHHETHENHMRLPFPQNVGGAAIGFWDRAVLSQRDY